MSSIDQGVVLSATTGGVGTYTDRIGATRTNTMLTNAAWVGMNTNTVPTAIVHPGAAGKLTAWVYVNKDGGGFASVDIRIRQKYGGSDTDVAGTYADLTVYDNASKTNTNAPNYAASGVYRIDTENAGLGGALIVQVYTNGAPAGTDAVKVAITCGGML